MMHGNKPIAELGPLLANKRLTELPELLAYLPKLSETEAEAFADDLASARSTLWPKPATSSGPG
jgi:hypothetical protein